jgi:hypothetical protein
MQNYWKQKDLFQKHQIQSNMHTSKEILSKLTGIPYKEQETNLQDEDALLESLNNLDYLLVQQKMSAQEKQNARLKLAEHMGVLPRNEDKAIQKKSTLPKHKGVRGRIDEIKSQRSEVVDSRKYGAKLHTETKSEHSGSQTHPEEIEQDVVNEVKKERVIVNSKFNIKDLLA